MKSQGRRNYLAGAGVTLVALFIWFSPPGMLGDLELLYQKTQFRWRGPEPAGPEVVIEKPGPTGPVALAPECVRPHR